MQINKSRPNLVILLLVSSYNEFGSAKVLNMNISRTLGGLTLSDQLKYNIALAQCARSVHHSGLIE